MTPARCAPAFILTIPFPACISILSNKLGNLLLVQELCAPGIFDRFHGVCAGVFHIWRDSDRVDCTLGVSAKGAFMGVSLQEEASSQEKRPESLTLTGR